MQAGARPRVVAGRLPGALRAADPRAAGVVARLLSILLDQTGLSGTNRLLGAVFGVARGAVLSAVVVAVLAVAGFDEAPWWSESKLIPYAAPIADRLGEYADQGIEMLQTPPMSIESL